MHLIALLLLAAPAAAPAPAPKDPPPAAAFDAFPEKGAAGMSFFLPTGSDPRLIGLTYFMSNDVAARLDFGLFAPLSPSGPGQNVLFSISAGLRYYQVKHEHVGVFLQPIAAIGRETSPAVGSEAAVFLRFGGGVGVEYFFTPRFSVGGILELTLKLANIAGPGGTSVFTTLSTDTSSVSANIYF